MPWSPRQRIRHLYGAEPDVGHVPRERCRDRGVPARKLGVVEVRHPEGDGAFCDDSTPPSTGSVPSPSGSAAASGFTVAPAGPVMVSVPLDRPSGLVAVSCWAAVVLAPGSGLFGHSVGSLNTVVCCWWLPLICASRNRLAWLLS